MANTPDTTMQDKADQVGMNMGHCCDVVEVEIATPMTMPDRPALISATPNPKPPKN